MRTLLLVVLLFALVAVLHAQDALPSLLDTKKLSGILYKKAYVNDKRQRKRKRPGNAFPMTATMLEDGSLEVQCVFESRGKCNEFSFEIQKTKEPGKYIIYWGAMLTDIYELPVKDHYIIYSEFMMQNNKFYTGMLIGKDPSANLEALEIFKKFSQSKEVLQEIILMPKQRERCVPDHDHALQNCPSRARSATTTQQ